jgi:hypothetical protein
MRTHKTEGPVRAPSFYRRLNAEPQKSGRLCRQLQLHNFYPEGTLMRIKKLLLSLLPTLVAAPSLAATINVSPGSNVISAVAGAHPGDTVLFNSGTYNLTSPINVPNGVTLAGVSSSSTHLIFNLAGGSFTSYGIVLGYTQSNVTIENLDLVSNHGLIQMSNGAGYNNITVTNNNLQYGPGQLPDGTLVFGISATVPNNNLQITHNYFHDSTDQASRNWCIWFASNSHLDNNLFYNIEDGGQIADAGANLTFSYNYGTHIHRMGQEGGLDSQSNVTFDHNVFYDWTNPYPDSDALSIVGVSGKVTYSNNYFRASIAPGSSWGTPDGGGLHRFGIAIEGTGQPAYVTGNTFVGLWATDYSSTMVNAQVSGNSVYGGALWGYFDGEPGPYGYGSVVASNNSTSTSMNNAPNPPANTFAGPNPSATTATITVQSTTPSTPSSPTTTGGTLTGGQSAAASSYNLSTLGTTDWAHWGRGGSSGNFDHKSSGGSQISNVSSVGSGGFGGYHDPSRNVNWTGGSPTSSDSDDTGYIWANNGIGAGYSFTVPAGTTTHTVYVYLGGYSSGSTLTAHLSDGSSADYVVSASGSAIYTNVVAITYKAASANQTLKLTYAKSQNINGTGGSADLIAAWLQ